MATNSAFFTLPEERAVFRERGVELGAVVEKVFWFQTAGWSLPPAAALFSAPSWEMAALRTRERELFAIKAQLSSLPMEDWKRHTARTKVSCDALSTVRRDVAPEMCTRAFCKLYEMLTAFPDLLGSPGPTTTLHLCEAPGAFVAATNHFLRSRIPAGASPAPWRWVGGTLDPKCAANSASDATLGRGAQGEFLRATRAQWEFGPDGSGNMCDRANAAALVRRVRALSPAGADLVTADGSVPCWRAPGEQERTTAQLHFCEVATALAALRPGGSLVCKLFTTFEDSTACLIRLLGACFDQLALCKPVASSEGNSETYLVALRCATLPADLVRALHGAVGARAPPGRALLPEAMLRDETRSPRCVAQIVGCADLFASAQSAVIERNVALFRATSAPRAEEKRPHVAQEAARAHQRFVARSYAERFQLRAIDAAHFVVPPRARSRAARAAAEAELDDGTQLPTSFAGKASRSRGRRGKKRARTISGHG